MRPAWLLTALLACAPALATDLSDFEPGTPPAPDQVDDITREVSSGLRCPVCQGLSVAASTSNAAVQMHDRIREMVVAGYSQRDIEDYFISKYGEWVLLEPRTAQNPLLYAGPLLAAGIAVFLLLQNTGRRRDDEGPDTVVDEPHTVVTLSDPHLAALVAEVEDDR